MGRRSTVLGTSATTTRTEVSLSGWFAAGPAQAAAFDREIQVPFPPESVGIGGATTRRSTRSSGTAGSWAPPTLPAASRIGGQLLLHFGAVDYRATVWWTASRLAEHVGGQTPFTVDVTAIWHGDERPRRSSFARTTTPARPRQPTGKQDWELEPHGIWYHRTTGIWQTVWLEAVPRTHIAEHPLDPGRRGRQGPL